MSVREALFLRRRYGAIVSYTGATLSLAGALLFTPLLALPFYPEELGRVGDFAIPGLMLTALGLAAWRSFRPRVAVSLSIAEGGIIVVLAWMIAVLFSSWPLMTILGLDFTRAFFEAMSGWTTTGLSVVDVSQAGPLVLLWRSIMQFAGGAGLAIIMLAAITGPAGASVSAAEGRGDQLVPHVRRSARLVMLIYTGYAIIGTLAYVASGMSAFDAVNHAFAAISTGGFSTRMESIGFWNSPVVEAVTLPLMIFGNLSFVTAWMLFNGRLRAVTRNAEVRLMAVILPLAAALIFSLTALALYPEVSKAVRVALFESVTALTTTGFSTVSYADWNGAGVFVLIVLMLIGGGTCSTAGGIKQYRIHLWFRSVLWEIRRALLPRTAVMARTVWEKESRIVIDDARLRQVGAFIGLYLMTVVIGTAVIAAHGYSLQDSLFEFASAVGTVGLSVGITSAAAPDAVLWTETVAMFLGRLEFFVIVVSVAKLARDLKSMAFPRGSEGSKTDRRLESGSPPPVWS